MYVTFLEYFLLQQIKRLNIKRIAVSDHVRGDIPPGGITVPQLSAYPDSFTHGKVLSQLFPLMNLYVSSEPFQSTVNPFMKQVSIQASKTLYTEVTNSWVMFGKLFDNGVVIKTVSKGNSHKSIGTSNCAFSVQPNPFSFGTKILSKRIVNGQYLLCKVSAITWCVKYTVAC